MFNCEKLFKLQIRSPSLILLITTSQDSWIFPSQSWEVRNSEIIIIIIIIIIIQNSTCTLELWHMKTINLTKDRAWLVTSDLCNTWWQQKPICLPCGFILFLSNQSQNFKTMVLKRVVTPNTEAHITDIHSCNKDFKQSPRCVGLTAIFIHYSFNFCLSTYRYNLWMWN